MPEEHVIEEKIQISNQLWSRKCNLACDYCRIALPCFGNYICRPKEYPNAEYYRDNERDVEWWCELNRRLYEHNNDILNILYGGEIFLHPGHIDILKYMSNLGSDYTIITSANETIVPKIHKMFKEVGRVKGFTCSVDPGFWIHDSSDRSVLKDDEVYKSKQGFEFLKYVKENDLADDVVAEITVSANTLKYYADTVNMLSDIGIWSDITFVDVAKNNYYDFSSVMDENHILTSLDDFIKENKKIDECKLIHMRHKLFEVLLKILPSNGDCKIEEKFHNISIDSDGKLRLCLRIRGSDVPEFEAMDVFDNHGKFSSKFKEIQEAVCSDKSVLCSGCNWTCPHMSLIGTSEDIKNHQDVMDDVEEV